MVQQMQAAGLASAVLLSDYGLHIYYNVQQLVGKVPLSPAGNPWSLPQNQQSAGNYGKGACPRSDALFARSILLPIPSRLVPRQEEAAVQIIKAAMGSAKHQAWPRSLHQWESGHLSRLRGPDSAEKGYPIDGTHQERTRP